MHSTVDCNLYKHLQFRILNALCVRGRGRQEIIWPWEGRGYHVEGYIIHLSSSFYAIPEERSETICLDLPADTRYLILPSVVFAAPKSKQFKDAIIGGKGCTGTGAPWTVKICFEIELFGLVERQ